MLLWSRAMLRLSLAVEIWLNKFAFEMINPLITFDETEKWEKLWSELFLKSQ